MCECVCVCVCVCVRVCVCVCGMCVRYVGVCIPQPAWHDIFPKANLDGGYLGTLNPIEAHAYIHTCIHTCMQRYANSHVCYTRNKCVYMLTRMNA